MNISRNNYEEYFLLYADRELSVAEKNMVEMFVEQNPDLEEEFIMLQQSVVKPDNTITLENKSSLYKNDFINQYNYEEKFLLYADNELMLPDVEETEKFVLSNPLLQSEFSLLQQVKYSPDTSIVFPDKNLLYKKDEDTKVIPFRWRALAAAILLGVGLWTGLTYLQKDKQEDVTATNQDTRKSVKPAEQNDATENVVKTDEDQKDPVQPIEQRKLDNRVKNQQEDVEINIQPVEKLQIDKTPETKNQDIAIVEPVNVEVIKPSNELTKSQERITEPANQVIDKLNNLQTNNNAQYASYITDAEVKSENYVFYNITTEEFKKSKVGNFLKKVKRVVENRIPFRGKGLKIGNVEIAKDE